MRKPRIGFLGTGWIGRHRMEAMLATGAIEAVAIADPSLDMANSALALAPQAALVGTLDEMLEQDLDGVAIATPSALHAEQSIRALDRGVAVFCQKPLGRDAGEAMAIVAAAKRADKLLAVDFSYRFTAAMHAVRQLVESGEIGTIFAIDLTFHNAYGPGKPWFFDRTQSGGGCVIDLGVHLVDLALWITDFPSVQGDVAASLLREGTPLVRGDQGVEDYAVATFRLSSGALVRLACSWNLPAGKEAEINATFYGTRGGAALRNVGGSFYDFTAEHYRGTECERLVSPPDDWGGRAAADWAKRLADDARYDGRGDQFIAVAQILDRIYAAA